MNEDPKAKNLEKLCAFYEGYGHETNKSRFFMTEVEILIQMGHLKDFLLALDFAQTQFG